MRETDLRIEFMRGTGPGGQHRNKTESACRITHLPSGITAYADERSQHTSKRKALKELRRRLADAKTQKQAAVKKSERDRKIQPGAVPTIRTYHFARGVVKDHRTGKTASIKDVMEKGGFVALQPKDSIDA